MGVHVVCWATYITVSLLRCSGYLYFRSSIDRPSNCIVFQTPSLLVSCDLLDSRLRRSSLTSQ